MYRALKNSSPKIFVKKKWCLEYVKACSSLNITLKKSKEDTLQIIKKCSTRFRSSRFLSSYKVYVYTLCSN